MAVTRACPISTPPRAIFLGPVASPDPCGRSTIILPGTLQRLRFCCRDIALYLGGAHRCRMASVSWIDDASNNGAGPAFPAGLDGDRPPGGQRPTFDLELPRQNVGCLYGPCRSTTASEEASTHRAPATGTMFVFCLQLRRAHVPDVPGALAPGSATVRPPTPRSPLLPRMIDRSPMIFFGADDYPVRAVRPTPPLPPAEVDWFDRHRRRAGATSCLGATPTVLPSASRPALGFCMSGNETPRLFPRVATPPASTRPFGRRLTAMRSGWGQKTRRRPVRGISALPTAVREKEHPCAGRS